ncbi:MAG: L,D-transpeptidase family protein [Methylophaga sp.]|nr:L,D-transpeptidase family protein [Methylophaga sp.]
MRSLSFLGLWAILLLVPPLQAGAKLGSFGLTNDVRLALYQDPTQLQWFDDQQLNKRGEVAISWLQNAEQHGLKSRDYQLPQLLQQINNISRLNARETDELLTATFLRLTEELAIGRIRPAVADPDWHISGDEFDSVAFLNNLLSQNADSKSLNNAMQALLPQTPDYAFLQQTLAGYRQIGKQGGWPAIGDMPLLKPGEQHAELVNIRQRLAAEFTDIAVHSNPVDVYDEQLVAAVKQFQERYSLKVDGIIGSTTRKVMSEPVSQRISQLRTSLERLRWLPDNHGDRYLMVNLAGYQLTAIEDETITLNMRVIIGRSYRQTPSFNSVMSHIVFNPYWTVPNKIARLDILPKQQADPDYLASQQFQVFEKIDEQRIERRIDDINWQQLSSSYFPYILRQQPGPLNALGTMKFMFPNPWSIYLHDTPQKDLFAQSQRNFSSGCIRVEDPLALAAFSLDQPDSTQLIDRILASRQNTGQLLKTPLPVYAVYQTAWSENGEIRFAADHYGRDARMAKLL